MITQTAKCRYCQSDKLIEAGQQSGQQRFKCKNCGRAFQLDYSYEAHKPGVKEKIERIAHNGNGIREALHAQY